ncbi:ATP-binding protein [Chitinophaga sp.]|uniref:ATP-binding protein n=1 Tax=Chitinophaga sp. TaxID=1869181 RepID=UPI0031E354D2
MQQLKIRKFGPLKEVELKIQDYMIFIGPQASGKSTILKILYIFKSLREEVFRTVADIVEGINADPLPEMILKEHIVNKFKSFWDSPERYGDFFLQYNYGNDKLVSIFQKKKVVQIVFSDRLEQEIRDIFAGLRTFISERYKDATQEFKENYYLELDSYIYELFDREQIPVYIPAGRVMAYGIFGRYLNERLDNTIKIFIQQIAEMRPLYFEQLEKMVNNETAFNILDRESVELAIALIKQILKGDYIYGEEVERIKLDKKGAYIEMPVASTGQQESLWLMMQLFTTMLSGVEYFIIIDEPEAHLYPLAQKQLIALITLVANYTNNQVVMTTNSPTVLKTINNQVYAGRKKGDDVAKVMNSKFWLKEDDLGAYIVEDGVVRNIVEENGMISPEMVDIAGEMIEEELKLLEG